MTLRFSNLAVLAELRGISTKGSRSVPYSPVFGFRARARVSKAALEAEGFIPLLDDLGGPVQQTAKGC